MPTPMQMPSKLNKLQKTLLHSHAKLVQHPACECKINAEPMAVNLSRIQDFFCSHSVLSNRYSSRSLLIHSDTHTRDTCVLAHLAALVCTHQYACKPTDIYTYICMYVYLYIYLHTIHMCMYSYMFIHLSVHAHVSLSLYMNVNMHVHCS